ncbi:MAG TPA: methyltransferase domain-containing protein [Actinomycetales bacterium]|nr:methyltransferase domain-containing protein [Actinomycetales bacterium]
MLDDVLLYLRCPVCARPLERPATTDAGSLLCASGHRFDVARQGYVNLLPGGAKPGTADTAEMLTHRAAVQAAGHFRAVADALAAQVAAHLPAERALVLDVGAGTGYYLANVLDEAPQAVGLALDISKHAARRAARCHPRAGAVVADAWQPLPVHDNSARAVLNVFAPRAVPELRRVLHEDGVLATVVPAPDHLAELVQPLGLLRVDDDKAADLRRNLAPSLVPVGEQHVRYPTRMTRDEVVAVAGMGPSAWHTDGASLAARAASMPDPATVTVSVHLMIFRPG